MKRKKINSSALVLIFFLHYILQFQYFVNSDTEFSVNLSTVDKFFRTSATRTSFCDNLNSNLDDPNYLKCFNTSLVNLNVTDQVNITDQSLDDKETKTELR